MRAVTENFPTSVEMPPIQVMITKGKEDMSIKVRWLAGRNIKHMSLE